MSKRHKGGRNLAQHEEHSTEHNEQGAMMNEANEVQINEDQQENQAMVEEQSAVEDAQGATSDDQRAMIEGGADILAQAEHEEPSTTSEAQDAELDEGAETQVHTEHEEPSTERNEQLVPRKVAVPMGIGQFVRYLLLNSEKTNVEILELVKLHFQGSRTTPACIAWYKTDLRKKGLLEGNKGAKNARKTLDFSQEELEKLTK